MGFLQRLFGEGPPAPRDVPGFADMLPAWDLEALRRALTTYRRDYTPDQVVALEAELQRRGKRLHDEPTRPRPEATAGDPFRDTSRAARRARKEAYRAGLRERAGEGPVPGSKTWLPSLRLQLFREDCAGMRVVDPASVVRRALTPGLWEVLVLDQGGVGETTLDRTRAATTGLSDEELFDRARLQAMAEDAPAVHVVPLPQLPPIETAVSNRFYLGACMLETLRRSEAPHGFVVAPVSWHHWVTHAVTPGLTTQGLLEELGRFVLHLADEIDVTDAEWLGTTVYWWRRDQPWAPIPFEEARDGAVARPPEALAALLG